MGDTRPRARENCSFYPACYIAGDCDQEGWKTGICGLSAEDKADERKRTAEIVERACRHQRLIARVHRGEFDHLDIPAKETGNAAG